MTLVVGIDPSAKHVAAVGLETITRRFVSSKYRLYEKGQTRQDSRSIHAALVAMRDFTASVEHMAPAGDRIAYVERPLVGRGGVDATMKQSFVGGVIRAWLVEAGFHVYDVNVSTWRKTFGIATKGMTTSQAKAATSRKVRAANPTLWMAVQDDGDLIDAAAIALHGAEKVGTASTFQPAQPAQVRVR